MDVSTGTYFNSSVNKLKGSGKLKRDTRLGCSIKEQTQDGGDAATGEIAVSPEPIHGPLISSVSL